MLSPYKRLTILMIIALLYGYTIYVDVFQEIEIPKQDNTAFQMNSEEKQQAILVVEDNLADHQVKQQTVLKTNHNNDKNKIPSKDKIVRVHHSDTDDSWEYYIVKFGDTLWNISKKCFKGVDDQNIQKGVFVIAAANSISRENLNKLYIHQKLRIPKKEKFDLYYQKYLSYLKMRRGVTVSSK